MRRVEERLLGALRAKDIPRLRHLLEACLVGLEKRGPGTDSHPESE